MSDTTFTWHTIEHMLRDEFNVDDDTYKGIAKDIWNAAIEHFVNRTPLPPPQRCTSKAPQITPDTNVLIAIHECVLPQGHEGWHSDGTEPRPMRWTP